MGKVDNINEVAKMPEKNQDVTIGSRRDDAEEIQACLRGEKLYGDDFLQEDINAWFKDEEAGYYNLGAADRENYEYGYHALNMEYGFRFLPDTTFSHVLGVGSAYGDELLPIVGKSSRITILEPAEGFVITKLNGYPVEYKKPQPSGILPFAKESFDLIICLGVLHHIPNVSTVVGEFFRCLKPNGYVLIREPIKSLGDWRKPRKGLTKRERGIPLEIFRKIILSAGFEVVREQKCMFSLTSRLRHVLSTPVFNSRFAVFLDKILCSFPLWSNKYHPTNPFHKLSPSSVFYVLRKSIVENV